MEDVAQGQPLKLAKAGMKERFLAALAKGASYNIACGYAGFHYQTFRRWMIRAESILDLHEEQIDAHPDKIYYDFYCDVKRVESYAALTWLDKIDKASEVHWQAAAWKLERRFPNDYGRTVPEDEAKKDSSIDKAKQEVERLKGDKNGRSAPAEG
jgi:transposase